MALFVPTTWTSRYIVPVQVGFGREYDGEVVPFIGAKGGKASSYAEPLAIPGKLFCS
jgi:hypothetical protein